MSARGARIGAIGCVCAAGLAASGCGGGDNNSNNGFRPPVTRVIGMIADGKNTKISPAAIGAGPITLKITNNSDGPIARVSLRPADGSGGCVSAEATAGPIPSRGTGTLQATLTDGSCEVIADSMRTSTLEVSGQRPSAQNVLLLP